MISNFSYRFLAVFMALGFTVTSHALVIDFTDSAWSTAMSGSTATLNDVTLSANNGKLSFNSHANERRGCVAGQSSHGLKCDGDGIGIGNDEISSYNKLTVSFSSAVNILNVDVLDMFGREGESASIMTSDGMVNDFKAAPLNDGVKGGFWSTGFQALGITELVFYSKDWYNDYALARIEYDVASVSEPSSLVLLGVGLLGFAVIRRKRSKVTA